MLGFGHCRDTRAGGGAEGRDMGKKGFTVHSPAVGFAADGQGRTHASESGGSSFPRRGGDPPTRSSPTTAPADQEAEQRGPGRVPALVFRAANASTTASTQSSGRRTATARAPAARAEPPGRPRARRTAARGSAPGRRCRDAEPRARNRSSTSCRPAQARGAERLVLPGVAEPVALGGDRPAVDAHAQPPAKRSTHVHLVAPGAAPHSVSFGGAVWDHRPRSAGSARHPSRRARAGRRSRPRAAAPPPAARPVSARARELPHAVARRGRGRCAAVRRAAGGRARFAPTPGALPDVVVAAAAHRV